MEPGDKVQCPGWGPSLPYPPLSLGWAWGGKIPGGGHGNPFQYSCLETPMDRGAWWATVHGVAQSWTRLKGLSPHAHFLLPSNSFCFDLTFYANPFAFL